MISVTAAMYSADVVSGLLHWAFDTWFDETNTPTQRMVRIVREHHIYPQKIFNYGVGQEVGLMSWFGLLGLGPAYINYLVRTQTRRTVRPVDLDALAAGLVYSILITFSLEFHKQGHRFKRGRLVRALQAAHVILSPEHHMKHHSGEHDDYYCIVNGFGDSTLGRLGFFRLLESGVTTLTGMKPRENDREWRRRFGRWVAPD
jgi:TMEM189-like protein